MIDDVIMHCTWRHLYKKKTRETWPDWFTSYQSLYCIHCNGIHRSLWGNVWHSQQNSSNNAKCHCQKVESTRNGKLGRLSGRFQTQIWRPGETVQNLESSGLSGRVDSIASTALDRSFMKSLIKMSVTKNWSLGFLVALLTKERAVHMLRTDKPLLRTHSMASSVSV